MSTQRILCIRIPNWPIQRLLATQPELAHHPVVLSFRHHRRGRMVAASCMISRGHGIYPGMPLSEATAICPDNLHISPYKAEEDLRQLQRMATTCKQFSPLVGIENTRPPCYRTGLEITDQQPQSLLINISGTGDLLGGEQQLVRRAIHVFHQHRYHVHLAIATTLGTAWALSHFASPRKPAGTESWFSSFPSNHPARNNTSSRAWLLAAEHTQEELGKLPPQALRIPPKIVHQLQQAGIEQIGTLYQLPRASLAKRLGQVLIQRLDQAAGFQEELLEVYHPPKQYAASRHLEYPTCKSKTIQAIVLDLLESLTQSLTGDGRGVLQMESRFVGIDHQTFHTNIHLFEATADPQHLNSLLAMQWNQKALRSPVQEITLTATCTAPLETHQRLLLNPSESTTFPDPANPTASIPPMDSRRMAQLVDRLSRRLGMEQILQPRLKPDAQPERAYQYVPWITTGMPRRKHLATNSPQASATQETRPLHLLCPPRKIRVTGTTANQSPIAFTYRQQSHQVIQAWGPERIETGWWRGPSIRRDYYRVQTTTGHYFWLFRDLSCKHWHLHGTFS